MSVPASHVGPQHSYPLLELYEEAQTIRTMISKLRESETTPATELEICTNPKIATLFKKALEQDLIPHQQSLSDAESNLEKLKHTFFGKIAQWKTSDHWILKAIHTLFFYIFPNYSQTVSIMEVLEKRITYENMEINTLLPRQQQYRNIIQTGVSQNLVFSLQELEKLSDISFIDSIELSMLRVEQLVKQSCNLSIPNVSLDASITEEALETDPQIVTKLRSIPTNDMITRGTLNSDPTQQVPLCFFLLQYRLGVSKPLFITWSDPAGTWKYAIFSNTPKPERGVLLENNVFTNEGKKRLEDTLNLIKLLPKTSLIKTETSHNRELVNKI